ncbi:MAG: hypothetical protein Q3979_04990, partial [Actinomycetaceae bacterium]|nr:hypothetical protein [Actinomycetaceae bacterium]
RMPSSEEPSSPEETTTYETPDSDDFDTYDRDSGSKPSRDEVKAGFKTLLEQQGLSQRLAELGATDEQINNFYGCIVDNVYDDMSAESLQALVNDDTSSAVVSSEEQSEITSAARTCRAQLGQEVAGSNAG